MTLFNPRGINGSGKSTVFFKLKEKYGIAETIISTEADAPFVKPGKIIGYKLNNPGTPIYVMGSYEVQCGGCDAFSKKGSTDWLEAMVRRYATIGHVLFEGMTVSQSHARWAAVANETRVRMDVFFLNTTMEECIRRVEQRRLSKGNTEPFDPNKNLIPGYKGIHNRVKKNFLDNPSPCIIVHEMDNMAVVDFIVAEVENHA